MAELVIANKADLMAVEFLPSQTVSAGGTATSDWQDIPPDYEFDSFAVVSGGTGVFDTHFDSSLDILDSDDTDVVELQSASGAEIGLTGKTAINVRCPVQAENAGTNAGSLSGLRVERIRARVVETGASATVTGLRVVGYFRKRNLPGSL